MYLEKLRSGIVITQMLPGYAASLEALQHKVFPHLSEEEILHAGQYLTHLEIFPEGQFVALHHDQVVGATTTMRYHYDPGLPYHHTFSEVTGNGWLTTHDETGDWLYGVDASVYHAYRKMGIAKRLYQARQQLCRQLKLKGQLIVGMLNGYIQVKEKMSLNEYFERVKSGEHFDPTVSAQMKIGFEIIGLMKNYLHDPTCDNSGAIMILEVNKEIL